MRKQVEEFAACMENRLQEKDDVYGKEGWLVQEGSSVRRYHDELTETLSMARHAMNDCDVEELKKRCIDIGNFAMMMHSRLISRQS